MKGSPFLYGKTVKNIFFTDRTLEGEKLYNNLINGINTMIISPRRWGKSSLVEKVISDINKKNKEIITVIIDLFYVNNEEEFLEIFAREIIKASSTKWQQWVKNSKEFFKMLLPRISIGVDPVHDFSLSFDYKELKQHFSEILDLPEAIAREKGIRFVVCLDEFQNIATFPGYESLEKKIRAAWQRHSVVTYCLYGSKRHMMSNIFNNPSKPFYRFGDIVLLQKIPTRDWTEFIVHGFAASGKSIDREEAGKIPAIMKNHSWYVQQLAHYTWNLTKKTATQKEIDNALNELIGANLPLYQKEIEIMSGSQLNLLKALANKETQFTSAFVMHQYKLGTPRNVSQNKQILLNRDLIEEMNGRFEFVDPAFEIWFKKNFVSIILS